MPTRIPVKNSAAPRGLISGNKKRIVRRIIRIGVGIVSAGLVFVLAVLVLLLHKTEPPKFRTDSAAIPRGAEKLKLERAADVAGAPLVLHVGEAELNSYIDSQLALVRRANKSSTSGDKSNIEQEGPIVRDLRMNLIADRFHVYLVVDLRGTDFTLEFEGRLHSRDGYMQFEPLSGEIGAVPIPRSLLADVIQTMFDSPEYRKSFRLPPQMNDLKIENGELLATYK